MLQEDCCCQRIHISFPITRRAPHFANCSKRGSRSEPFIDQLNRQPRTALQVLSEPSNLGGPLGIISILVEWQPENETPCLEHRRTANELRDRHPLSQAALDEAGWRGDHTERVADREADSPLAIVDG
jgi:hypothetical protein